MGKIAKNKAKELKKQYHYHTALKILDDIPEKDRDEEYYLLKSQCYYQDFQLPKNIRFDKAISTLDEIDKDSNEKNRLYGAIYKRKYEYFKNKSDLNKSIKYYKSSVQDIDEDLGYGLGNLIYLYCLKWDVYNEKLEEIQKLVNDSLKILESLSEKDEWNLASMATLYLFRGDIQKSKEYLLKYKDYLNRDIDRDQEITLVQLVKLFDNLPSEVKSKFQNENQNPIDYLLNIYPHYDNIIESARNIYNKIGLALSGGGFRASLYHIGTLTRLAELGLLHQVEVISTVSGGSIVGMMYYLMLKQEFENGDGENIDYIKLVNELKKKFLEGIQENIRMKAFEKDFDVPLTKKLGELYQEVLYDKIEGNTPTLMKNIAITPHGFDNFNPHFHNFTLKNKVPRIIINATLLNNGHNWQFTAKGMGENSYMYDRTIDKNLSYPFKSYSEICGDITIGEAIATSSAVPMLFDPVEIEYIDDKEECSTKNRGGKLQICDGGVYDNLGLASLVNDECTHIIISDGSKQMTTEYNPSIFRLDVLSRTQDILMTKNRDAEYRFAHHLKEQGIIEGLIVSHMKEDINDKKLDCLFNKISSIRTDLDAFNDIEANAIIYSGYKITSMQFEHKVVQKSFNITNDDIPLGEINEFKTFYLKNQNKVIRMIENSSNVLFKAFKYVPKIRIAISGISILLFIVLSVYYVPVIPLTVLLLLVMLFILNKKYLKWIFNKVFELFMKKISKYYLKCINPKYLKSGEIE